MRDPITDAAQDPSCLLCLTPDRGGSWWSRLRPAMPRNFAANPMTFTDSYTAQDGIGTDDFTLSVDFTLLEESVHGTIIIGCMRCIYYDSTKGHQPCVWILKSDGTKSALYPVGTSHISKNVASIKVIKTGQNVRMVVHARDGSTIKEGTVAIPDGATVTSLSGATTYPGNIFAASIRNDTTGAVVWQAAHSDLYAIYEPRNFADNPIAWTGAKPALDVTDQSHDFTFEIEFKCVKTNAVYVFASDTSRDFIRVFMSGGEVIVSTALLSTASGGSTQFSAGSDSTNRHVLTVKMIENTITALIDGEIVYTRENLVRNAIEISAPRSNAGYVYKISITDDTTGEIVWQAAHSNLYTMLPPPPWPSPVPRNFAEEPEAWTDAMTAANGLGEDNWAFEIKLNLKSQITGAVFNNLAGSPLKLYDDLVSSGEASFFLRNYVDTAAWTGRHSIRLEVADGNASLYLDSEFKAAKATGLTSVQFEQASTTSADVEIEAVEFVNLTTGRTVWSYPSEAERVRLITKTNVRTDRGAFEAADETQPARVDTALDLRGEVSSYTVVVDFEAAEFPETTTDECHQELAGQGGALIGSGSPPICSIGYYLTSSGSARLQLSQEVAGGRHVVNATLTGRLSGRHTCCGVVEVDPASPLTASTLYLDGVRIGNASIYAVPTGNAAVNATRFSIAGHSFTGGWPLYTGKVYSCLLFNRALSAAEIAALTPKQA